MRQILEKPFIMFLVIGFIAFIRAVPVGAVESQKNEIQKPEAVVSQEDLEVIRDLEFLENLPILSEEDFSMFEDQPIVEGAQKEHQENI